MKTIKWIIIALFYLLMILIPIGIIYNLRPTSINWMFYMLTILPFQLKCIEWIDNFNKWFDSKLK